MAGPATVFASVAFVLLSVTTAYTIPCKFAGIVIELFPLIGANVVFIPDKNATESVPFVEVPFVDEVALKSSVDT